MFSNTNLFRDAAFHFKKYGRYDDGPQESQQWIDYWTEEKRRCIEGYSVGGCWITGLHYFYLNYCPIQLVRSDSEGDGIGMIKADRETDFPDFWDLDYMYFMSTHIARNGIKLEDYNKLPMDLNLDLTPTNLTGGKNMLWLKGRGQGASWKSAVIPAWNYNFRDKFPTFLVASQKEFLNKDGLFSKFLDYRDFVNTNTGWWKANEYKNDISNMHVRASYKNDKGMEAGRRSDVMGITLHQNFNAIRGKRGDFLMEEFGKFPSADQAWRIIQNSVEEGNKVFGQISGFGTGGVEGADFAAMEKMIFDPDPYNILRFKDIHDEGMSDISVGFFTPATYDVAFKDKDGNSDKEKAKLFYDNQREIAAKSPDPSVLVGKMAEKPYNINEAILNTAVNIFPVAELQQWMMEVETRYQNIGVSGDLISYEGTIKFKPNPDLIPIIRYPHSDYRDLSGAIVQYEPPLRDNGKVPSGLYVIVCDPYIHDNNTTGSLGAIYVLMQTNNLVDHMGNKIVASYVGRPAQQEDFNRRMFLLADYYNAEIGFENNQPGGIVDFGKRHNKLWRVRPDFQVDHDPVLKANSVRRGYGIHMNEQRILQGDVYLKKWLLTERAVDSDGKIVYNYHTIYDPALLKELIRYNPKGNFDRVSAMRVGMYHLKELEYNKVQPKKRTDSKSLYFDYIMNKN